MYLVPFGRGWSFSSGVVPDHHPKPNSYTNDLNGNTLTGGGRTNTWDSQNRLYQCVYNGTTSQFTYAADGLRHRTVRGQETTDYVLDASMFVRENRNGTLAATYLVGPRGPESTGGTPRLAETQANDPGRMPFPFRRSVFV